jgi:restriction system protein
VTRADAELATSEKPASPDKPASPEKTGEQLAAEKSASVQRQIKALDEMLSSATQLEPLSFDRLAVTTAAARFNPGPLGVALAAPSWESFAPTRPTGLRRLTGRSRYKQQLDRARAGYENARTAYLRAESQRGRALVAAKARHDREVTEEHARAAAQNSEIARRRLAFAAGDRESVEWFVDRAIAASRYLNAFPRDYQVSYQPRTVQVVAELPPGRIVPSARAFRYVISRSTVEPLPRPDDEIRQRYKRFVCAAALRVLYAVFAATPAEVVDAVGFSGWIGSADPATGKPVRPCLVSVTAGRAAFSELVLASVEPVTCLAHLDGVVSPDPFALQACT